eukprot:TRINITY_DN1518_c0_g3_i1.p1 TRINITY_DN1518_c0_g3~~TRINITY_DN1518_c0_g3_i1.p1  ORF type:complete len:1853 (+),score=274.62 TRINITY_DN1518_c0_g3_i1:75-5633(+)
MQDAILVFLLVGCSASHTNDGASPGPVSNVPHLTIPDEPGETVVQDVAEMDDTAGGDEEFNSLLLEVRPTAPPYIPPPAGKPPDVPGPPGPPSNAADEQPRQAPNCTNFFKDYVCPSGNIEGVWCIGGRGWYIGDCTLKPGARPLTIRALAGDKAISGFIQVQYGRTLSFGRGDILMECHNCTWVDPKLSPGLHPREACGRAIYAPAAVVLIKRSSHLFISDFAPCFTEYEDMDIVVGGSAIHADPNQLNELNARSLSNPEDNDGGAIRAKKFIVYGFASFEATGAPDGSGGAVAATCVEVFGKLLIGSRTQRKVWARVNGGGLAVLRSVLASRRQALEPSAFDLPPVIGPLSELSSAEMGQRFNLAWLWRREWRMAFPAKAVRMASNGLLYVAGLDDLVAAVIDPATGSKKSINREQTDLASYLSLRQVDWDPSTMRASAIDEACEHIAILNQDSLLLVSIGAMGWHDANGVEVANFKVKPFPEIRGEPSLAFNRPGSVLGIIAGDQAQFYSLAYIPSSRLGSIPSAWKTPESWKHQEILKKFGFCDNSGRCIQDIGDPFGLEPALEAPGVPEDFVAGEVSSITFSSQGYHTLIVAASTFVAWSPQCKAPLAKGLKVGGAGWYPLKVLRNANSNSHFTHFIDFKMEDLAVDPWTGARFSPDGRKLLAWSVDSKRISVLDVVKDLTPGREGCIELAMSPSNKWIPYNEPNALAWSSDSAMVLVASYIEASDTNVLVLHRLQSHQNFRFELERRHGRVTDIDWAAPHDKVSVVTDTGFILEVDLRLQKTSQQLQEFYSDERGHLYMKGDAKFRETHCGGSGGSIFADVSSVDIQGVTFNASWANSRGGAIDFRTVSLTMKDIFFGAGIECANGLNVATLSYSRAFYLRRVVIGSWGAGLSVSRVLGKQDGQFDFFTKYQMSQLRCESGAWLETRQPPQELQPIMVRCKPCPQGTAFFPRVVYDRVVNGTVPRHFEGQGRCLACAIGMDCKLPGVDMRRPLSELLAHGVQTQEVAPELCKPLENNRVHRISIHEPVDPQHMPTNQSYLLWHFDGERPICMTTTCLPGHELDQNGTGCVPCPRGYTSSDNRRACTQVPVKFMPRVPKVTIVNDFDAAQVTVTVTAPGKLKCAANVTDRRGVVRVFAGVQGLGTEATGETKIFDDRSGEYDDGTREYPIKLQLQPQSDATMLLHSSVYKGHCKLAAFDGVEEWQHTVSVEFSFETQFSMSGWSLEARIGFASAGLLAGVSLVATLVQKRGRSFSKRLWSRPTQTIMSITILWIVVGAAFWTIITTKPSEKCWSVLGERVLIVAAVAAAMYAVWLKAVSEMEVDAQIDEAMQVVSEINFPVVLLRSSDLFKFNKIPSHEEARASGALIFLDTKAEAEAFLGLTSPGSSEDDESASEQADGVISTYTGFHQSGRFAVFFSHQWTGHSKPDPEGKQFQAICDALHALGRRENKDPADFYAWVDYFSIPQANLRFQSMAINSLPVYASLLQAFVIVAPNVKHFDTGQPCDMDSYQRRGWCRAEQLCHRARRGSRHMFLAEGCSIRPLDGVAENARFSCIHPRLCTPLSSSEGHLPGGSTPHSSSPQSSARTIGLKPQAVLTRTRISRRSLAETFSSISFSTRLNFQSAPRDADLPEWFAQALYVFSNNSEFSCCRMRHVAKDGSTMRCDREALKLPMLGLYAEIYRGRYHEQAALYAWIGRGRDEIFPPYMTLRTPEGLEQRPLFGDLVRRLENKIDAEEAEALMVMEQVRRREGEHAGGEEVEMSVRKTYKRGRTCSRLSSSSSNGVANAPSDGISVDSFVVNIQRKPRKAKTVMFQDDPVATSTFSGEVSAFFSTRASEAAESAAREP